MFSAALAWLKSLFTAKKVGIVLAIFAKHAGAVVVKEIMDPDN